MAVQIHGGTPYDVKHVLDMYGKLSVDYGVTLDHIPFFGDPDERIRFTIESAIKSYEIWKRLGVYPKDYIEGLYRCSLMALETPYLHG